jgi:hypothetical protein
MQKKVPDQAILGFHGFLIELLTILEIPLC